jgi:hypothetical protein
MELAYRLLHPLFRCVQNGRLRGGPSRTGAKGAYLNAPSGMRLSTIVLLLVRLVLVVILDCFPHQQTEDDDDHEDEEEPASFHHRPRARCHPRLLLSPAGRGRRDEDEEEPVVGFWTMLAGYCHITGPILEGGVQFDLFPIYLPRLTAIADCPSNPRETLMEPSLILTRPSNSTQNLPRPMRTAD